MNSFKIKVFLVDDHQVLLDGLMLLLKDAPEIQIVGTACNGRELLEKLKVMMEKPNSVDVILMDINMPILDGLEATRRVKRIYPDIKIIMLTMSDQMLDVNQAVAQGADGFLSKNNGKNEIIEAINKVYQRDEFVVYTNLDKDKSSHFFSNKSKTGISDALFLTEREKQIICLICQEYPLDTIASLLSLSLITITAQRKNILGKLGVTTDAGIAREAIERGLCEGVQLP
ncbi:MAG: DNA-binding response regulator [Saprospiraceae bacterium]|nr:MAG: DNA-binding response regulator [Saprospiraceae bacterium]